MSIIEILRNPQRLPRLPQTPGEKSRCTTAGLLEEASHLEAWQDLSGSQLC